MLCRIILRILIRIDGSVDVYLAIECATTIVVTTIDTSTIRTYDSITTAPVDVRLINVAWIFIKQAIGTSEDFLTAEGRA